MIPFSLNLSVKIKMFLPVCLHGKYNQIRAQVMASEIAYKSRIGLNILFFYTTIAKL